MDENQKKVKQVLIALSIVNDAKIPQRLEEIKGMIIMKKWEDEDFVQRIMKKLDNIESNRGVIELCEYLDFKKVKKTGEKPESRKFYFFKDIEQQIALAVKFHELEFLENLHNEYKLKNKEVRSKLSMPYNTTNFGNISYNVKKTYECKNKGDNLFRPFYFDWRKKWKEFIGEISKLEVSKSWFVKIDFKNCYGELKPRDYSHHKNSSIDKLIKIQQKYFVVNINEEGTKTFKAPEGVPYGGPVESHMLANMLILDKLKIIGEKFRSKGFELENMLSYADDSCFILKKMNNDKDIDLINEVLEEAVNLGVHKIDEKNKSKTYIFDLEKTTSFNDVKESYTSLSTVNAMFLASELSDEPFTDVIFNEVKENDTKTSERIKRKYMIVKIWNFVSFSQMQKDLHKFLDYKKYPKSVPLFMYHLLKKFESEKQRNYILKTFVEKFIVDTFNKQITWNAYFPLAGASATFAISELAKVYLLLLDDKEEYAIRKMKSFLLSKIEFYKDQIPPTIVIIKKLLEEKLLEEKLLEDKEDAEKFDSNFVSKDLGILEFISNNRTKGKSNHFISKFIRKISNMKKCEYDEIKINSDIFKELNAKNSSYPNYWGFTKKSISYIFTKIFEEHPSLIYWRFKRLLEHSENRIDFILNMQYLKNDLDKIADLNETELDSNDINAIKLILMSPPNLLRDSEWIKATDKLILIRQFVKLLWKNGSLSTQSFTAHDHTHGDTLLMRYHQFNASKTIRSRLTSAHLEMYPLIASFYLHDIGMLVNVDKDRQYNGRIDDIYQNIAQTVRKKHGAKTSDILFRYVSGLLGIPDEWLAPIALASIYHQDGGTNLAFGSKKNENNAIILSILDLLDVTYERTSILSRFLTGSIVDKETLAHWQKHYVTKGISITWKKDFFEIVLILNKNIMKKYNWDSGHIEGLIKSDITKYMGPEMIKLKNNITGRKASGSKSMYKIVFNKEKSWPENHMCDFYEEKNSGIDISEFKRINDLKKKK